MEESVLSGGSTNVGRIVRIDGTIRRPRGPGHEVVETLLLHLADVGFERAPRLLGIDDENRQVLEFVEGEALANPPWQLDDAENARRLGELAGVLTELHEATAGFLPPAGCSPARALPLPGPTWTHGDIGYSNTVYADGRVTALIDWEFAAPADPLHGAAALLAMEIRGPRPDVDDADNERRGRAARLALDAIATACDLTTAETASLPHLSAAVLDDAATYWTGLGRPSDVIARTRWRADWFRCNAGALAR